jgi:DNA-binding transcriptional regulator YiaG
MTRKISNRGQELLDRALRDPSVAADVATIRTQMEREDRRYATSLAAVRRAAALTQDAVAAKLGAPQSSVSRLEAQSDMLLSTFAGYLDAVGTHPRVVVTVDGQDVELDLHALITKP